MVSLAENPRNCAQDALRELLCQVALPPSEYKLLSIASAIRSSSQAPWVNTDVLPNAGVIALGLVAKHQNKLIDEIDALPEAKSIKLAELVKRIPKKAVI